MIDSHAHLNDEKFVDDLNEVVERAREAGITAIFNVGYDLRSSHRAVQLAEQYDDLYAVVGVHPHDADTWSDQAESEIIELLQHPKVLAIGETGLDYHYDHSPREVQQDVFRSHLQIAQDLEMPVVIHSREAAQDTMEIVQEFPNVSCVLHCYSGSWEMAKQYIKMGYFFSVGGSSTFKNADRLRSVIRQIPLERLFLETDCPYLTPVPHRGKRNEPAYLTYVADQLASIHGVSREEVVYVTESNTRGFFKMS